jgi:hypothetical protein
MTDVTPSVAEITTIAAPAPVVVAKPDHPLVSIALFCAIGLLLSLTVILLDRQLPGEWF